MKLVVNLYLLILNVVPQNKILLGQIKVDHNAVYKGIFSNNILKNYVVICNLQFNNTNNKLKKK